MLSQHEWGEHCLKILLLVHNTWIHVTSEYATQEEVVEHLNKAYGGHNWSFANVTVLTEEAGDMVITHQKAIGTGAGIIITGA